MNAQIVPIQRQDSLRDERMLFVRTEGILQTMVKAPLVVAGLIIFALGMPIQNSFSSTRSLDLIIYPDGSTHVSSVIDVDPLEPDYEVKLFGTTIDNFVAIGENGFLLSGNITGDSATIDTFGTSSLMVDYDTHDLISKEGRIWTFSIDSPSDYSLLMPQNSVIVGMSNYPLSMEIVGEQSKLLLPTGEAQIDYLFSSPPIPIPDPTPDPNPIPPPVESEIGMQNTVLIIGGIMAAAGVAGLMVIRKTKRKPQELTIEKPTPTASSEIKEKSLDDKAIFKLRPELRDDDKEIVSFLYTNGGQALESELRKKFLQPRTTMWRAVKRLERQGIVEIVKKDLQNLVILKKELEEEQ